MKYYAEEVTSTPLPKCTAYDFIKECNKNCLDNKALRYYGKTITYRELFDRVEETAKAFHALGVKAGDTISFVSVAVPECVAAIYALNKLGATANMIDPRMDIDNIRRMINETGSDKLVVIDVAFPKIKAIMNDINQKHILVQSAARSLPLVKKIAMKLAVRTDIPYGDVVKNWDTFLAFGKGKPNVPDAPYIGDAVVAIAYTGGTTGFPKGVMLTNDSMNAVGFNFLNTGIVHNENDSFLGIIPVFTSYGMVCGMHMPFCMGCELIPIPRFVPTDIGKLVRQHRPNHMIATPAFYEVLMNSKEMVGFDLSFLLTMGSGGDTMNEGLEGKLKTFMKEHNIKYPLAQGYGMSELSAAASFCVNDLYKERSVGIPSVTTTVSIFDPETGEELTYGEIGEVCVAGPSVMKGYYQRPEETANVMRLHDDGQVWIHSGDLGYMDEDGFLYIKGRVKRMITRFDGHKVFPVNIESMVCENKSVHSCSVIGINDREHSQGQYPFVVVELIEGADRKAVCKAIFDECNARLEERGKPVAVVAVDKMPLTGSLKNDFRTLEEQYADFDYTTWDPEA